ncbi:serpin B3-like [Erythrolamprus reginae]|uniref:serpin B3-like n=1 Tax=Erythrolamprus reginae TaxID=121349 RepID=UPI00396C2DFF
MNDLVEANSRFAVDVFKQQMDERLGRNMVLSPIILGAGISMVFLGTRTDTAQQIRRVLHITGLTRSAYEPLSETDCDKAGGFHSLFKQLLSAIHQRSKHYPLKICSRLYASKNYDFLEQYLQCIEELYNSELKKVDFMTSTEEVRQKINSWVERQTNGDVKNFFPATSFNPSILMVLVNAISFKGFWKIPFNPKYTRKAVFWTCKDQSIHVEMMVQQDMFNIGNLSNPPMQVLELPYDNDAIFMYVLLPDNHITTDEIIKELTYEKIQEWTRSESMRKGQATVYLPKFRVEDHRVEDQYSLKPILLAMGVKDLFISGKADLSGMSGNRNLAVSQIRHKVFIEVNEDGARAVAGIRTVVPGSHPEFKANRPFLFILRDAVTKSILFMGRICWPL